MRSKEAANSALLSVSFRSKNESKVFLQWLQKIVANVKDIPSFPPVRKLTSRKRKTLNLLDSCRAYLMIRESIRDENDKEIDFNDIESLILDIADNIPERLVLDVSAILRQYNYEIQQAPDKKEELSGELLKKLTDSSSLYFDMMFSLMCALDILEIKGQQRSMLQTKAAKIQKQRVNDMSSFSVYLLRLMENIEAWDEAKAKALKNKLNKDAKAEGGRDDDHDSSERDDGSSDISVKDDNDDKISRVKNMIQHQWGWSLHCLFVSVQNKELSPLDQWLLEEEKRILAAAGNTGGEESAAGDYAESVQSSVTSSSTDSESSLLLSASAAAKPSISNTLTTFIANDDRHSLSDFDEPYYFKDINTSSVDSRDQSSLEDIAQDRDMIEKLKYSSSKNKILIENLPPMITEEELCAAFERAGGSVKFIQIFHPERFEAAQPCHATIQNKKVKRKTQMKQIIHSDTFAYVAFDSDTTFNTLTTGDIRLFGICMKGFRCKIRPAKKFDTFYFETLSRKPTKYWIDIISSILGHDHELVYGSAYSAISPAFMQLKFNDHESAWKAFLLLELALTDGVHYYQLNWRKCTWYYDLQTRSREKRRNNQKYLNSIADKIHAGETPDAESAPSSSMSSIL